MHRGEGDEAVTPQQYMGYVAELGCLACRLDGIQGTPAQVHHPRAKAGAGERGRHDETIPLCPSHHLHGGEYPGGFKFPGIHQDTKAFRARYGEDWLLTELTRRMVAELENSILAKRA